MLQISEQLKTAYPGGWIGEIVFKNVRVREAGEISLRKIKGDLEGSLRQKYRDFSRSDLILLEPIKSYVTYYKQFKKTYHVLLQLESVIWKQKSIPNTIPLVIIMFMAELKNLLLTAGHDLDSIVLPIGADLSKGNERYRLLKGMEKELPQGDMMMTDRDGIISSIIYGPDNRTQITEDTNRVLYTVYAPPGIEEPLIREHFNDFIHYIHLVVPQAEMEEMAIHQL
ncbi:MAG: phenylalanine--tRNA ligase beta subunit-related protein [Atribacterota bacterium]|nr:phenylalanine--tRNA ligase beta subunit-related protein [Atribacterota bacterium]MDD4895378.1 phenylalanine--tRNA ligase beta subunit-related protein [Atribacterota bacterium]MDD5637421.1 phenylalanine--tRNA ligase beta subunit-related protein [Atribacterota bacterium]